MSGHSSLKKYTSHFIWKGSKGLLKILLCKRWVGDWTELQHIDSHSYDHNSVSFPFSWLLNRGPRGPAFLGHGPHSSFFSPTDLNFLLPGLYHNLTPTYFLRASQFRTQFNPSTVKVAPDLPISSNGFTSYLHRCISSFHSLAGSEVNMQHIYNKIYYFFLFRGIKSYF